MFSAYLFVHVPRTAGTSVASLSTGAPGSPREIGV
jgi:hypothetical protein